ncbi:single-strand DNA-binding protein [Neolewinella xylanilytica]|uniref:Single-stranded DNA-binding protein n=1 Tax=Neolewinella xylanilytica TaxID=1514080 RepID=A0A2S6I5M9_9BACT|nr:single-stranded DNA-binding protein [Neolewinella xylanilytica]PPK86465.1 single-strand DNA-binding protein [Neolewinella xylanilytica]
MLPFTNQLQLIGRAGHDPELLTLSDGTHRSTLRLYQNGRSGTQQEDPQIHHLVAWSGVARQLQVRVSRGDRLLIQGKLLYRRFECKGVTQVRTEIHVDHFAVLDRRMHAEMSAVAETDRPSYGHRE